MKQVAFYRVKNLRPDLDGRVIQVVVPNDIRADHPSLELIENETDGLREYENQLIAAIGAV